MRTRVRIIAQPKIIVRAETAIHQGTQHAERVGVHLGGAGAAEQGQRSARVQGERFSHAQHETAACLPLFLAR